MIFLSKTMLCFMMHLFQFHKYVLYCFWCQIHFLPQCVQANFKSTALIFLNWKDLKVAEKLQLLFLFFLNHIRMSCQTYAPTLTDI